MIEDKEKKQYPKEATPEMVGEMAKKFEEMRQMTGSDGRYDKPKPKKKVMEPIEIPPIISVPRYRGLSEMLGHDTQPIKKVESYNTRPETAGLSQRFTQDKIHEGKILKQLDRELAIERDRGRAFNREGKNT